MSAYAFNTLEQAKRLQQHGFDEQQAEGLVEVIALSTNNLATKQDIEQIKLELRLETRQEFSSIHLALAKLDNKILSQTISLGVVIVGALGAYTYLLQWLK